MYRALSLKSFLLVENPVIIAHDASFAGRALPCGSSFLSECSRDFALHNGAFIFCQAIEVVHHLVNVVRILLSTSVWLTGYPWYFKSVGRPTSTLCFYNSSETFFYVTTGMESFCFINFVQKVFNKHGKARLIKRLFKGFFNEVLCLMFIHDYFSISGSILSFLGFSINLLLEITDLPSFFSSCLRAFPAISPPTLASSLSFGIPFEPKQRAHSPLLAAGLASELKIDAIPYGRRFPVACCGELQSSVRWISVVARSLNMALLSEKGSTG